MSSEQDKPTETTPPEATVEAAEGAEPETATGADDASAPAGQPDAPAGETEAPPAKPEAAEAESEERPLAREGMNWYVLRVASNKEDQVKDALERKVKIEGLEEWIGRIIVPTKKEKRFRGGTARIVDRKLYPGYVFVEMRTQENGAIPEHVWFTIKETTGVGDFIGSAGKPTPMRAPDVEKMLAIAERQEETPGLGIPFKKGDHIKIREGSFENFEGVVDAIDEQKGTVTVLLTIFGRSTPVDVEYWQLEKV